MAEYSATSKERRLIETLVKQAEKSRTALNLFLTNLFGALSSDDELSSHVHSMKWRVKDPDHLRDKLFRKLKESKEKKLSFGISEGNLFSEINDLAGLRILHLHTREFEDINRCLLRLFKEHYYRVVEKPTARIWDIESQDYFEGIKIKCVPSESMYTSVHYVIKQNRLTLHTCEVQVRTLAEELWGEVNHSLNYPHETPSLACREQIKVLARVTSSCSRLVDSIFLSHDDHHRRRTSKKKK